MRTDLKLQGLRTWRTLPVILQAGSYLLCRMPCSTMYSCSASVRLHKLLQPGTHRRWERILAAMKIPRTKEALCRTVCPVHPRTMLPSPRRGMRRRRDLLHAALLWLW